MTEYYTLIIDTNLYSGHFEREMCGYITGQIGECGVGSEEASEAEKSLSPVLKNWFDDNIQQRADEGESDGCMRPCAIVATPGRVNGGMGKHYSAQGYNGKHSYPAYESVGIFFSSEPRADVFCIAKERAAQFAAQYTDCDDHKKLRILDVRLVKGAQHLMDVDTSTLR